MSFPSPEDFYPLSPQETSVPSNISVLICSFFYIQFFSLFLTTQLAGYELVYPFQKQNSFHILLIWKVQCDVKKPKPRLGVSFYERPCKGSEVCQGGRRKGILGDAIRQIRRDVGSHNITGMTKSSQFPLAPFLSVETNHF